MSNFVFVGGTKGGTTKSCSSHLLCLGSVLCKQPAAYVLTDPRRKLKSEGRPYGVLDGTDPTCVFGMPSSMIQDKEAMISISDKDYKILKVPVIEKDRNTVNDRSEEHTSELQSPC